MTLIHLACEYGSLIYHPKNLDLHPQRPSDVCDRATRLPPLLDGDTLCDSQVVRPSRPEYRGGYLGHNTFPGNDLVLAFAQLHCSC
eukprot:2230966-Prymnesium_polylepis.1